MIVFIQLALSLTIVNDDPLLTIVNDDHSLMNFNKERKREETALRGISTYHLAVLKKISRSFSSTQLFTLMHDNIT